MSSMLTEGERREIRREALLRAIAIVQLYQDENWRRLRVNDICSDLRRLLQEEAACYAEPAEAERSRA